MDLSPIKQFAIILVIGTVVGIGFAFAGDPQPNVNLFVALATVQGSFLAILITLMLLSIQITAEEYSSLTVRDVQNKKFLTGLIVLFVVSILLNAFYILTIENPLWTVSTSHSVSAGMTIGLATICLLSLIPGRDIMTESIAPEKVLLSSKNRLKPTDVPSKSFQEPDQPPQRNPLAPMEQVLVSAEERNDESTVRRAIYEMGEAAKKLIQETDRNPNQIDDEALFECLNTCDEVALQGEYQRIRLVATVHSAIARELIQHDLACFAETRLDALVELAVEADTAGVELIDNLARIPRTAIISDEPEPVFIASEQVASLLDEYQDNSTCTKKSHLSDDKVSNIVELSTLSLLSLTAGLTTNTFETEDDHAKLCSTGMHCFERGYQCLVENRTSEVQPQPRDLLKKGARVSTALVAAATRTGSSRCSEMALKALIEIAIQLDESVEEVIVRLQHTDTDIEMVSQVSRKLLRRCRNGYSTSIDALDTSADDVKPYLKQLAEE